MAALLPAGLGRAYRELKRGERSVKAGQARHSRPGSKGSLPDRLGQVLGFVEALGCVQPLQPNEPG